MMTSKAIFVCLLCLAIGCSDAKKLDCKIYDFLFREFDDPDYVPSGKEPTMLSYSPILNKTKAETESWGYTDVPAWNVEYPTCGGPRQSPINLNPKTSNFVKTHNGLNGQHYGGLPFHLTLQNNGHGVDASSTWEIGKRPTLQADFLNGEYIFHSLHWHWGSGSSVGSEHTINNKASELEMHLIHYNSKFPAITDAIASGEPDALAVVGVLFEECFLRSNLGMLLTIVSMQQASSEGKQLMFLPLGYFGINLNDNFYTYLGSLTTPPCDQIVRWIVLENPLYIHRNDMEVLRNIVVNGKALKNIYRPVQPINNRTVTYYGRHKPC